MRSLALASVSIRAFRNLTSVDVELGPRFNVVSGDNGQGKTNLLEAAYVLATSRSFRTARLSELIEAEKDVASIRGRVREEADEREQSVGLKVGVRVVRVDGERPATLAAYAVRTPTVAFHPGVMALSTGSGGERRRLLDRIALYRSPGSLADVEGYARAVRTRQRVLEARGERAADLEEWEALVVRHALAVRQARQEAAAQLVPAAQRAFARIGQPGIALVASYEANAPGDPEAFAEVLRRNRPRDRARGSATSGPHRDDLSLTLGGRAARGMASQGQHRAIVLALELAEIDLIAEVRGVRPILLLDDVSSELDRARTQALFAALRGEDGQILLTTTRPDLIDTGVLSRVEDRSDFTVVQGRVAAP
jgi:DNA replication and repair protein RecF